MTTPIVTLSASEGSQYYKQKLHELKASYYGPVGSVLVPGLALHCRRYTLTKKLIVSILFIDLSLYNNLRLNCKGLNR